MATQHGRTIRVFVGGFELTSYLQEVSANNKVDDVDTTTFSSSTTPSKTFLLGFREGEMMLSGLYDPTATSGSDVVLNSVLGSSTATNVSVCWAGATWAIGDNAVSASLRENKYNVKGSVGSAIAIEAGGKADGGIDYGECLHTNTTAVTSSETAGSGTSVDFGSASTGAWAAYLHATACTGTATIAIKTGTDNITFGATLTTFTGLTTAVTSEQKTGTSSTSWRYASITSTLASSPSYSYAVFLARR